jgi:Uma2 family endonuclease
VFVAPLDFRPTRGRSLQPDVLVARRASIGDQNLTVAPVLAVEVLSDGTRSKDLIFKQEMYQTSGVASYWVIDPAAVSIVAYDLDEGIYRRGAQAQAGQTVSMRVPFTVPVCPADLIAGR